MADVVIEILNPAFTIQTTADAGFDVTVLEAGSLELAVAPDNNEALEIGIPGPQGPAGPTGGSPAAMGQTKFFATASNRWEFTHNLGFVPCVMLYDATGQISGRVVENTTSFTAVEFFMPVAGRMSIS